MATPVAQFCLGSLVVKREDRRFMKKIILSVVLLCSASICEAESGIIKSCRTAYSVDSAFLHKSIKLPAGLRFIDSGTEKFPNVRNSGRPVYISLTKDVVFPNSGQCAVVIAETSQKPQNYSITRGAGRLFKPNFVDNRADFIATILSDFR